MKKKLPQKSLKKGQSDFRRNVTLWGIEGGSIRSCPEHPAILLKTGNGPQGGYDVIQVAWAKGFISSDKSAGTSLLDKILEDLPDVCPQCH